MCAIERHLRNEVSNWLRGRSSRKVSANDLFGSASSVRANGGSVIVIRKEKVVYG